MAGLTQADEIQGDMVPLVVTLAEAAGLEPTRMEALLGNKAANLARLAVAGFPVPAGVVVTPTAAADWERACARLGRAVAELGGGTGQRFAVRSSGTAEDLAGASFAGQYETVLDVGIDELPGAVRRVLDSAASARVSAYRRAHPEAAAAPAGDSSGAGAGMAVLIQVMVAADAAGVAFTANPLTGDREEVVITAVRGLGERLVAGQATGDQWIVRDGQARCTRAAEQAITGGQARQIATLARRVHAHFTSPQDLEWAISAGTARANGRLWLLQARPMTALPDPVAWTPPARGYWMRNLRLGEWLPEPMTPLFADWLLERVDHGELQPRYRRLVLAGEQQLQAASPEQLAGIIDQVGAAAGEQLWSLEVVGGSAWKMEGALARFYRQHLASTAGTSVQRLLAGLPGTQPDLPAHAVQSLDWAHPTAGELGWPPPRPSDRHRELAARREALTAQFTAALAGRPRLQEQFRALLEVTQRYVTIREQQARHLTLGWPLLRRCALRLGQTLRASGVIDQAEDVFFLTRAELGSRTPSQDVVSRRRATWERQRRLPAPLTVGRPASPGRATGPARIVHGPGDFDGFQAGEVLVARATTPAWTPLFARAVAVVTDGGTLAAHASLVAREYGIPAVVGTGDATSRLHDSQVITVDGSAGLVEPLDDASKAPAPAHPSPVAEGTGLHRGRAPSDRQTGRECQDARPAHARPGRYRHGRQPDLLPSAGGRGARDQDAAGSHVQPGKPGSFSLEFDTAGPGATLARRLAR